MPNNPITKFTSLNEIPHNDDVFIVVDVSDTQQSDNGMTKKISYQNMIGNSISTLQTQVVTNSASITSIKTKTDLLTVPSAVNTDTLKSDILSAKTKTDFITVSQNVNLNNLASYNRTNIQTITTTGSINSSTVLALVNSSSDVTVTLPLANSIPAMTFINVKRLGTGNVIIALSGSDNLDGLASSYNFNTDGAVRYSNRRLTSDGISNWYLI